MPDYRKLDNIANSIKAAGRIYSIRESSLTRSSDMEVFKNRIDTISEVLKVIAEYSPETRRRNLEDIIDTGDRYINTYRDLKNHISSVKQNGPGKQHISRTLSIMKPVMNTRAQTIIDKVIRIYEIINS